MSCNAHDLHIWNIIRQNNCEANMECFVTAGRGTEKFFIEEIKQKLNVSAASVRDGKVLFKSALKPSQLLLLKVPERLFVKVYHNYDFHPSSKKALGFLKKELISCNWTEAVNFFQELRSASGKKQETVNSSLEEKRCKLEIMHSFRVSCKLSGRPSRIFDKMDICRCIGRILQAQYGWNVNLQDPNLEVYCQLNNDGIILGLPVTRKPLSMRPYIKNIGLRTPVAWIMSHLANIQPSELVLDPMCGVATIPIEASNSWKNSTYIATETNAQQLLKADENIQLNDTGTVHLIQASVTCLPLRDDCIDVIICDTPFGKNHSTEEGMIKLFPSIFKEFNRVLKIGGRAVILTSESLKKTLIDNFLENDDNFQDSLIIPKYSTSCTGDSNQAINQEEDCKEEISSVTHLSKKSSLLIEQGSTICENKLSKWILKSSDYIKLGETDSFVLLFDKVSVLAV